MREQSVAKRGGEVGEEREKESWRRLVTSTSGSIYHTPLDTSGRRKGIDRLREIGRSGAVRPSVPGPHAEQVRKALGPVEAAKSHSKKSHSDKHAAI